MLARLAEYNITLRRDKCKLGQNSVKWFGHIFSKQGMSPDPEKVETIKQWPEPKDKSEVKSFLQTVQFCAPYMRMGGEETYSDVTGPLRKLTRHGVHYKWTEECGKSFQKLKNQLSSDTVLMNFDTARETRLYVDHGPDGVASTIAQGYKVPGERAQQWRPVYHTSRALTQAERGYDKIDGESLAVYSGIVTNRRYLYGIEFTVVNDHEPLVPLYNSPSRPAPVRVERHRSKLRHFMFTLVYEPGYTSPCDYASRHPPPKRLYSKEEKADLGVEDEEDDEEIWVNMVEENKPEAVTLGEIREALTQDEQLQQLVADVQRGRLRKELRTSDYNAVFSELTYTKGLLLKGDRLLIPRSLYGRVISVAHEGHQGEDRTIRNIRERNWFPGLAEKCRAFVKTCHPGCTSSVPDMRPAPMKNRETPDGPWKVVSADYKGPIGGQRGYYFHVMVDNYSKWPEVCVTKSTKFEKLYPVLDRSFSSHGIPERIIHDNGPPYNSSSWRKYARMTGFEIDPCTPEHPQSNGLAEKMMTSIVKMTHAALAEGKDPKLEISKFLINYRNTPHSSTKKKPSELMMNRNIRTKLPVLIDPPKDATHLAAQDNDRAAKAKHKEYGDKHRRAQHKVVMVGDRVLIKQKKTTTKQPWDPDPYTVTEVRDTQVTAQRRSKVRIRNVEKWKVLKERPAELQVKKEREPRDTDDSDTDFDIAGEEEQDIHPRVVEEERPAEEQQEPQEDEGQQESQTSPAGGRRSRRQRKQPDRFDSTSNQQQHQLAAKLSPRQRKKRQSLARFRPTSVVRKERWVVREGWQPPEVEEDNDGSDKEGEQVREGGDPV